MGVNSVCHSDGRTKDENMNMMRGYLTLIEIKYQNDSENITSSFTICILHIFQEWANQEGYDGYTWLKQQSYKNSVWKISRRGHLGDRGIIQKKI